MTDHPYPSTSARRQTAMRSRLALAFAAGVLCLALPSSAAAVTETFVYTGGAQSWVVPAGVSEATFTLYGAEGGSSSSGTVAGGLGGSATATIAVTPGESLQVNVGGEGSDGVAFQPGATGGFNGGGDVSGCFGAANAGGGGGASDVRRDTDSDSVFGLSERLLVAGGGGSAPDHGGATGGSGGGATGGDGATAPGGGGGGTQTAGGAGGTGDLTGGIDGQAGQLGLGAASIICTGAGGGGLYGGGSGAFRLSPPPGAHGGGGGSGFTPGATGMANGVRAGDGEVVVSYELATFAFTGFAAPIDNAAVNVAKAGRTIPVQWHLELDGAPVSDPASFTSLTSQAGIGACVGLPSDAVETYAGESGLQYLGSGDWQFNWKTPKGYAGQCRTMIVTLADGSTHTATFQFK